MSVSLCLCQVERCAKYHSFAAGNEKIGSKSQLDHQWMEAFLWGLFSWGWIFCQSCTHCDRPIMGGTPVHLWVDVGGEGVRGFVCTENTNILNSFRPKKNCEETAFKTNKNLIITDQDVNSESWIGVSGDSDIEKAFLCLGQRCMVWNRSFHSKSCEKIFRVSFHKQEFCFRFPFLRACVELLKGKPQWADKPISVGTYNFSEGVSFGGLCFVSVLST